jgi:SHS2 domain-containing protein
MPGVPTLSGARIGWEQVPHGADIGVRGWGSHVATAFEQAALATTAIVVDPSLIRLDSSVDIRCDAASLEDLLVDWLNGVIFRDVDSLRASKAFPDGAVFVFDLLTANTENNAVVEGPRKVLGVMHRDAARFKETGGWGFEGFKGDTRDCVVKDPAKECFACHKADQPQDFVFSTWRK